jgi:hypothetical protein
MNKDWQGKPKYSEKHLNIPLRVPRVRTTALFSGDPKLKSRPD